MQVAHSPSPGSEAVRSVAKWTIAGENPNRSQAAYGLLCIIGTALPLSQFIPWLARNGPDSRLFFEEVSANHIGRFFGWDVVVSAAVVLTFLAIDGGELPRWQRLLIAVATCSVGVSCGLPLYLFLHARQSVTAGTGAIVDPPSSVMRQGA